MMTETRRTPNWFKSLLNIQRHEAAIVVWSFCYFFTLLASYYLLRPVRDEMGIAGGIKALPWLFTATFLVMLAVVPLFGAITSRWPRRRFLPVVYWFFIVNILIFYFLLQVTQTHAYVARAFFIWISVFNLFVVSVFWSFMVDLYNHEQAKRLFGFIAAGGSSGAVVGPALAAWLAQPLGYLNLLLISAGLLSLSLLCIHRLLVNDPKPNTAQGLGGDNWNGLKLLLRSRYLFGIAGFIVLLTTLSTIIYFEQARIVKETFADPAARTAWFARVDLAVNVLSLLLQFFVTGAVLLRLGVAKVFVLVASISVAGFIALAAVPTILTLMIFQIVRRAVEYALSRPAREILFTVVEREAKYKAKNVLDTLIYRGGDAFAGWLIAGLGAVGIVGAWLAALAVPIAGLWGVLGLHLGRRQQHLQTQRPPES